MLSRIQIACSFALLVPGAVLGLAAKAPLIGMVSAPGDITIDNARVSGNASLFEGSSLRADNYTRLQLNDATRLDLRAGTTARVYSNHVALEEGMTEVQSHSGYQVESGAVVVRPTGSSIARVQMDNNKVLVTALNNPVDVFNRQGMLVAKVAPGLPMSFLPQAGSMSSFDSTGCVLAKSGAAIIVDPNGSQIYELRGADLRKAVGSSTHIMGTIDPSATPAAGATQVIKVTSVTVGAKGTCSAVAAKIAGASTAAAGLGAAAGAGAAAAGGAAAGAAAAGAAISTTALVVGGVAAATAVGLGAAAATGAIGSSSP